jgi:hypothetical protein
LIRFFKEIYIKGSLNLIENIELVPYKIEYGVEPMGVQMDVWGRIEVKVPILTYTVDNIL